jgi:hypothetical protein
MMLPRRQHLALKRPISSPAFGCLILNTQTRGMHRTPLGRSTSLYTLASFSPCSSASHAAFQRSRMAASPMRCISFQLFASQGGNRSGLGLWKRTKVLNGSGLRSVRKRTKVPSRA